MIGISCRGERRFEVDPEKTALLVIDMQRDFIDPEGMCARLGDNPALMRAIVPRVGRLTEWARAQGMRIVHTREGYAADLSDMQPPKRARWPLEEMAGPLGRYLIRGEAGHDFVADLKPHPGEWVIDKPGFGAFTRTDLEDRLRAAGVEDLILCGVTTSCCVQTTMREAVDRGFRCLTVADCCAAVELDDHDRALDLIASEGNLFGWVCDLSDIAGQMDRAADPTVTVRSMVDADADAVMAIYADGIATGQATFQDQPGEWPAFSAGKLTVPRLVACDPKDGILGFAVLSPTSTRPVYKGVCEVSVYVSGAARGRGVGNMLMQHLVTDSEAAGIWLLTASIFPENPASLLLHTTHGFRCVGRHRGPARMTYGPMAGQWRDTLRLERRSAVAGI